MENACDLSGSPGIAGHGGYLAIGGYLAFGNGPDALDGSGGKGMSGHASPRMFARFVSGLKG